MGRRSGGCSLAGLDEEVLSGGCSVVFLRVNFDERVCCSFCVFLTDEFE